MVLTPLGVTHDDVGAAELGQHRGRRSHRCTRRCPAWTRPVRRTGSAACRRRRRSARCGGRCTAAARTPRPCRSRASCRSSSAASFCTRTTASWWFRFIFQLPAMRGTRVERGMGELPVLAVDLDHRVVVGVSLVGRAQQSRTSTPGRSLPSRYSRLAPPPVEMCPNAVLVEAELPHRRGGVATADDGQAVDLGQCLGDRPGAVGEGLELEDTHRAVPEHGPGVGEGGGERLGRSPARCPGRSGPPGSCRPGRRSARRRP